MIEVALDSETDRSRDRRLAVSPVLWSTFHASTKLAQPTLGREMTEQQTTYRPGDVVDGFILGNDNEWRLVAGPPTHTDTGTNRNAVWLGVAGVVTTGLVLGVGAWALGAASPQPVAQPRPAAGAPAPAPAITADEVVDLVWQDKYKADMCPGYRILGRAGIRSVAMRTPNLRSTAAEWDLSVGELADALVDRIALEC